ncbi:MAG: PEP-CTERM sorting domain-containing protein [Pirellulaceae bacterium]
MIRCTMMGLMLALSIPATANADLTSYGQNFENIDTNDGSGSLAADGWLYFASSSLGYSYNGPAPNGPQISKIQDDSSGGNNVINVYSDYNNGDAHNGGNPISVSVFQQQSFNGTTDLGKTWTFDFDYGGAFENPNSDNSPAGQTTVGAFIRVFDPSFSNLLAEMTLDPDNGVNSPVFTSGSLSILMDNTWTNGGNLQFGFTSTASNSDSSGMFYDNISFTVPEPTSALALGLGCLGLVGLRRRK